ncbi:sulfatase [Candidatus Hydrogenedentota bacterium]
MNVILVVLDTLRKDCAGPYGSPPWGEVHTPHFDKFAEESLIMDRVYPETLPTLPARRALYTGQRVYPFPHIDFVKKGDYIPIPGWGPIREDRYTLSELLNEAGYRTGLISDVFHMFKPSKNFWRGFDQWTFLRGQEMDPYRSGPAPTKEELDYWLPNDMRNRYKPIRLISQHIQNNRDRVNEEDYFVAKVFRESAKWIEQNRDAQNFFLTIESFSPHELWCVPEYYRKMYLEEDGPEQVVSGWKDLDQHDPYLLKRTQANYSALVTLCDRWFGHFMEELRVTGLLDDTLVVFTSDHGHMFGEHNFIGKGGYPAYPGVYDIPLMVRFPGAENSGIRCDMLAQHTDISATILDAAGVEPKDQLHGVSFLESAAKGGAGPRDHVTAAWGTGVMVVKDNWWLSIKVDGTGALLHDLNSDDPFHNNVADGNWSVVEELFALAKEDAGVPYFDYLLTLAAEKPNDPAASNRICEE